MSSDSESEFGIIEIEVDNLSPTMEAIALAAGSSAQQQAPAPAHSVFQDIRFNGGAPDTPSSHKVLATAMTAYLHDSKLSILKENAIVISKQSELRALEAAAGDGAVPTALKVPPNARVQSTLKALAPAGTALPDKYATFDSDITATRLKLEQLYIGVQTADKMDVITEVQNRLVALTSPQNIYTKFLADTKPALMRHSLLLTDADAVLTIHEFWNNADNKREFDLWQYKVNSAMDLQKTQAAKLAAKKAQAPNAAAANAPAADAAPVDVHALQKDVADLKEAARTRGRSPATLKPKPKTGSAHTSSKPAKSPVRAGTKPKPTPGSAPAGGTGIKNNKKTAPKKVAFNAAPKPLGGARASSGPAGDHSRSGSRDPAAKRKRQQGNANA